MQLQSVERFPWKAHSQRDSWAHTSMTIALPNQAGPLLFVFFGFLFQKFIYTYEHSGQRKPNWKKKWWLYRWRKWRINKYNRSFVTFYINFKLYSQFPFFPSRQLQGDYGTCNDAMYLRYEVWEIDSSQIHIRSLWYELTDTVCSLLSPVPSA